MHELSIRGLSISHHARKKKKKKPIRAIEPVNSNRHYKCLPAERLIPCKW